MGPSIGVVEGVVIGDSSWMGSGDRWRTRCSACASGVGVVAVGRRSDQVLLIGGRVSSTGLGGDGTGRLLIQCLIDGDLLWCGCTRGGGSSIRGGVVSLG